MAEGQKSTETTAKLTTTDHDRVVMASRHPDGSPDQTPDFEFIGDKEVVETAAKRQLSEQAVSAVDVERRGVTAEATGTPGEPDPATKELQAAQEKAAKAAESKAAAEVKSHHQGLGD